MELAEHCLAQDSTPRTTDARCGDTDPESHQSWKARQEELLADPQLQNEFVVNLSYMRPSL